MERAETHVVRPPAGELNVVLHHIDNAHRVDDTFDVRWIYVSHFATILLHMHNLPPKPNAASDATPAASTPSFPISTLPSAPSKGDAPLGNRQPSVKSGTAPLPRRRPSATDNPLPIRKSAGSRPFPPRTEQPSASAPIPASTHQHPTARAQQVEASDSHLFPSQCTPFTAIDNGAFSRCKSTKN